MGMHTNHVSKLLGEGVPNVATLNMLGDDDEGADRTSKISKRRRIPTWFIHAQVNIECDLHNFA